MHDVIITGAGPIGSYVARRLAGEGYRVLVFEKKSNVGGSVCTGIVGLECVETFGIDDGVILRKVNSANLYSPSGDRIHIYREEPQACILDRKAFDIDLAEKAKKAGAEYQFDCRVTNVISENDRALVSVSHRGKEEIFAAKVAVIASGFAPGLIYRLGLGKFRDYTVGAQAVVETPGTNEVEVYFGDVAPGFFAWLAPTTPPLARAGLLSRTKPVYYLRTWLEHLASRGMITTADVTLEYGAIPLQPLKKTCGKRLIVVGDAAGQVKPTSGGGVYYGLLSAEIAVKTLLQALADDDLSAKSLVHYEREWRRKLGRELRMGYWARRFYEHISNRRIDRIFQIVKAGGIDTALLKANDLSFDWHSRTILRLLRYWIAGRVFSVIKIPFKAGRIDR